MNLNVYISIKELKNEQSVSTLRDIMRAWGGGSGLILRFPILSQI